MQRLDRELLVLFLVVSCTAAVAVAAGAAHWSAVQTNQHCADYRSRLKRLEEQASDTTSLLAQIEELAGTHIADEGPSHDRLDSGSVLAKLGAYLNTADVAITRVGATTFQRNRLFTSMPMQIELQGSYGELAGFIAYIDARPWLMRVDAFRIQRSGWSEDDRLDAVVGITTMALNTNSTSAATGRSGTQ